MTQAPSTLPHWNMSVIYPDLASPEFKAGFQAVVASVDRLTELFDTHGIGSERPNQATSPNSAIFETILETYNQVLSETYTHSTYVYSFVSTNSRDAQAQAAYSEIEQVSVRLEILGTRLTVWLGALDVENLITRSPLAATHAFMLRNSQQRAQHLMGPAEEMLAAQLSITGSTAWARLYANVTSQLMVAVELADGRAELPISEVRNLAYNPNRDTRRQAFEAEIGAWKATAVPIAAALNSIKGEVNTLTSRQGWATPLDKALFTNNIDRQTLDAMLMAMRESFPDFRRYLAAKARLLNLPVLAWYDLFAPVGSSTRQWPFQEAVSFVAEHFATFSPRLGALAERSLADEWIDAEPRTGKEDGAFCIALRDAESRILLNYQPVFVHVTILAHELGHAYHNLNLGECTMLQRTTPMTLAETASIFCETIIRHAAFNKVDAQEQLAILETSLQSSCVVIVDIASRFLFEQQVFEQRQQRELSPDELCALMIDAQKATYGDAIDNAQLHPYMWAAKGHYYDASSFYNFPYAFGLLFGLGLYALYQREPDGFQGRYDRLLASTGLGDAAELAADFGIDLRTPDFWRASLNVIKQDIDRFEQLALAIPPLPSA